MTSKGDSSEIDSIKRQLDALKSEFDRRFNLLSHQLTVLQQAQKPESNSASPEPVVSKHQSEVVSNAQRYNDPFFETDETPNPDKNRIEPRLSIGQRAFSALMQWHPLASVIAPMKGLYDDYQARGQSALFIFLLVGGGCLVVGFSYLIQLLVNELAAQYKVFGLLLVSILMASTGLWLHRRQRFQEIATLIIGLGAVLGFLTLFLAGGVYQLLPTVIILIAFLLIAGASYTIARIIQSRFVIAVTVLGAGTAPFFTAVNDFQLLLFISGFLATLLAGLRLCFASRWLLTGNVLVASAFAVLQLGIDSAIVQQFIGFFIATALLAWITTVYAVASWQQASSKPKQKILMICAILGASIGLMYQTAPNVFWLSGIAGFNAVGGLLLALKVRAAAQRNLSLMLASAWLLIAIFAGLTPEYWSIGVGVEGLLLLALSIRERLSIVIREANILIAVAIILAIVAVAPHFPLPALSSLKGMAILASTALLLWSWYLVLKNSPAEARQLLSLDIGSVSFALQSMFISIVIASLAWVYAGNWWWTSAIIIQAWLLWRNQVPRRITTDGLYFACIAIPFSALVAEMLKFETIYLEQLPLHAKIAASWGFLSLWLSCRIYNKLVSDQPLGKVASAFRNIFFVLLPVILLPSVFRLFPSYFAVAFISASILAYFIGFKTRDPAYRNLSLIWFGLSIFVQIVAFLYFIIDGSALFTLVAIAISNLFSGFFIIREQKLKLPGLERKIASIGVVNLGLLIAASALMLEFEFLAIALPAIYFLAASQIKLNAWLRMRHVVAVINTALLSICVVVNWLETSYQITIVLAVFIIIFIASNHDVFYSRVKFQPLLLPSLHRPIASHCVITLLLALTFLAYNLGILIAPLLMLHASILLFVSSNMQLTRLALTMIGLSLLKLAFIDLADAALWIKVLLMLGIGAFLMVVAILYQRRTRSE